MKKVVILFIFLAIIAKPVLADDANYLKSCPSIPQKNTVTFSKVTGFNWLTEKIAQSIIRHELKKETKGKFKVKISSRSSLELMNGEFYSLNMSGKNLNVDGSHISKLTANTVCGYNSVDIKQNPPKFRENMILNYSVEIDNDAIEQTLKDINYVKSLKKYLPITDAKINIRNNKLYFKFEVPTYVTKPIQLTVSSGLNVKNGRVHITALNIPNNSVINRQKIMDALEKTNPFAFNSDIMDNKSNISVDSVKIVNDIIVIRGLVLIPKNIES